MIEFLDKYYAEFYFIWTIFACSIIGIRSHFLIRKGVNLYNTKSAIKFFLKMSPVLIFPLLIAPGVSILYKVILIIGLLIFSSMHYYILDKGGKDVRKSLDIETKWDKEEQKFNEKEKSESRD